MLKPQISIQSDLQKACPQLILGNICTEVQVLSNVPELSAHIQTKIHDLQQHLNLNQISQIPNNTATREAYKKLGKKPGRYRPSAEALLRRVVTGKGLYSVNNVVDLLNLTSISTGFSIGGYDLNTIQNDVTLGIGRANEPYDAIGRGALNIENLPVFRDSIGAFGTPTSDHVRTCVQDKTRQFWMVIYAFDGNKNALQSAVTLASKLLSQFALSTNLQTWYTETNP